MTEHRLQRRHFLMLFAPLAGLVILVAGLVGQMEIDGKLDQMVARESLRVRLGANHLENYLKTPQNHLNSLPNETSIRTAIDAPTADHLAAMVESFDSLLERNPIYDQVRWIDETGMERVRVERSKDGAKPVNVVGKDLQNKADRDYFKETSHLAAGKTSISPLDLNIENGRVETPYKPTLRFSTAVFDQAGDRRGILIINVLGEPMLANFIDVADQDDRRIMLVNQRGDWLSSPIREDEWGFMFGHAITLGTRHPGAWARMSHTDSGHAFDDDGLWIWQRVIAKTIKGEPLDEPHWLVVSNQPADAVRAVYTGIWLPSAAIGGILLAIFAAMSWNIALRSRLRREAMVISVRNEAEAAEGRQRVVELEQAHQISAILTAIVQSSEDAIVSKDLNGTITSWNSGAEKLFGYRADEAIGHSMIMLFPQGAEQEERQILEQIARGETVSHFETVRRHKSGRMVDVSVTISPILGPGGRVVGASKIARDVTEANSARAELIRHREHLEELVQERTIQIAAANDMLAAALDDAKAAGQAKSQFLTNMSHELRTPLNAILGFAQLLASERIESTIEQRREFVDYISKAGKHLLTLINEILDLARIEAGKVTLSLEPVAVADILLECRAMMEPLAALREIHLLFPQAADLHIEVDRTRFKQVLLNLLSNAIKYNRESGTVIVSCATPTTQRVRISVQDTGAGLSDDEIGMLFQAFERLGQKSEGQEGTGVGLVVTKRLVELMGGSIGVTSAVGNGSVFWIEFKATDPAPLERLQSEKTWVPKSDGTATLLYVEDNPSNLRLVEEIVRCRADLHMMSAPNGPLGIELARSHLPQLILMDIHLPGMTGNEAQRILRNDPRTAHIPVIALTANAMPREVAKGLAAGFFRYITKPIDLTELSEAIDSALARDAETDRVP